MLFVVVEHKIKDAKTFFGSAKAVVGGSPEGLKAVQFFPSDSKERAVCLWEAPSVDAVRDYLEANVGSSAKNTYYAVDSEVAMGLPVPA